MLERLGSRNIPDVRKEIKYQYTTKAQKSNKPWPPARRGVGTFLKVILMSLIEFQNVFPMINFDVWDRLGHVQTIFDTVGL